MIRAFLVLGLSGVILGMTFLSAAKPVQTDTVDPTRLLPEKSVLLLQVDGTAKHLPGLKQTAAWKSLNDSGMQARIFDLIQTFVSASAPGAAEHAEMARQAMNDLVEKGISMSVSISPDGQQFAPLAVLVLHDASDMEGMLLQLASQADEGFASQIAQRSQDGRQINHISPQPGIEIALWKEGQHLVFAAGINPVDRVLATLAGDEPNVSSHPLYTKLRTSDKCTVNHLMWLETKSLLDQFGAMPFPQPPPGKQLSILDFCDMLGIAELEAFTFNGGYKGVATWANASIIAPGPRKKLLKLLDQRNITFGELPPMPANTDNFMAGAFDIKGAVDLVLETAEGVISFAGENEKAQFDQGFERFTQMIGGHPRDVFSAGLGDLFCIYNDPASLPIPVGFGPVLTASVADRQVAEASLRRLFELAKQLPEADNFSIRESEKNGQTFFSLQIQGGVPVVPTVMVTDKWIVVSIMPSAAQSFNARLAGRLKKWEPTDEVRNALAELPKEFTSISVSDPRPGYQTMMTWAPMALGMFESQVLPELARNGTPVEMPFGIQDLPAAEELTEPMFPNVTVSTVTEQGVIGQGRQSVPGIPIGNVGSAAVVPILVALLLPAVQQAREAARRTQSKNNLKQVGLAMHNYHSVYNHFPQGTVENTDLKPEERLSWFVSILPFMDQVNLYNSADMKAGWESDSNKMLNQTGIEVLRNPSQADPGSTHYVGISGIGPDSASLPLNDPKAGIFGYNRKTRMRDITDGTSNTMAVADSSLPNQSFHKGGKATVRGFTQKPYINGPDGIGGPHTGGVNVLFADGSVQFVSENIDPKVLEALATKAGGEVIGEF